MSIRFATAVFMLFTFSGASFAQMKVNVIGLRAPQLETTVTDAVKAEFDTTQYREMRVKLVSTHGTAPDHAVVYLFSKTVHRFDLVSVQLDSNGKVTSILKNYRLKSGDRQKLTTPTCPDTTIQFIAFAPNDDSTEQGVTVDVANEAIAKGLKTVQLLESQATTQSYLNYMVCPNLIGNFYDGDANPNEFVTVDGSISSDQMAGVLAGAFRYKVTNIWLACEAFNDPMLTSVLTGAQAQKYAAGINDLDIGPSDRAGACAMKAAIDGNPMQEAFTACQKQFDNASDQWGFDGKGSDNFGQ
jgi:hypothetical protein